MFEIAERDASRQQLSQALSLRRAGGIEPFEAVLEWSQRTGSTSVARLLDLLDGRDIEIPHAARTGSSLMLRASASANGAQKTFEV